MYVPPLNAVTDDAEIRAMAHAARTGWLVTPHEDEAPLATLLPIIWTGDTVIAHMAKANPHWRHIAPGSPALVICTGPDAYISPNWYAAKAEHGRVVPTWNYTAVQLGGTATVHHDPDWLRSAVTELTDLHESTMPTPWHVTDAPEDYIAGQLRGIVGVEVTVTKTVGKAKLSQNRSEADQHGVILGLRSDNPTPTSTAVADGMAAAFTSAPPVRPTSARRRCPS